MAHHLELCSLTGGAGASGGGAGSPGGAGGSGGGAGSPGGAGSGPPSFWGGGGSGAPSFPGAGGAGASLLFILLSDLVSLDNLEVERLLLVILSGDPGGQ